MNNITEYLSMNNKTIEDFENVTHILRDSLLDQKDLLNKVIEVLEYFKVPDEVIDEIDAYTLAEVTNYFLGNNIQFDLDNVPTTIEINNRVYVANKWDEVVLKGRFLSKAFNKIESKDFSSYVLALIFKDEQLTNTEHLDETHIQYKQKLFKELSYMDYAPYILHIIQEIIKANQTILNDK